MEPPRRISELVIRTSAAKPHAQLFSYIIIHLHNVLLMGSLQVFSFIRLRGYEDEDIIEQ